MNDNNRIEPAPYDCPYFTGFAEDTHGLFEWERCHHGSSRCHRCRVDEATDACDSEFICGAPFISQGGILNECSPGCADEYKSAIAARDIVGPAKSVTVPAWPTNTDPATGLPLDWVR